MHSLSTFHEVFDAVSAADRNLRSMLPDLANFVGAQCAGIKETLFATAAISGGLASHNCNPTALEEVELQVALRSALAYLEKAHSDAGPLLFFRRGSLGYELEEVVRGLQHTARKVHAAGLSTRDATLGADASPVITWLTGIEAQLRAEVAQLFAAHGGDLYAMLAASQHNPLTASLLRAALLAEDPRDLTQRRLTDDDTSRHLFELHYDDVDMDVRTTTKKGRVLEELVSIGRGAYGQVFQGRYLGVPVAVKEFPDETASIINLFEREMAMLCALRHPNIVPLIGFSRGDRAKGAKYALVTPLLAKSFTEAIVDPSYTVQERLRWCVDIACALVYLHGRDPPVRHGDLKPANVMLDAEGNAVLLDFGLATASMTATVRTRGGGFTPAYAAPEVQAGGGRTTAADVFAFGLVLYEVWHRRPWFEDIDLRGHATHVEFLRAGLSPPLSLNAIPASAASLIAQCLATNPSDRPSSAELLQKIRAFCAACADNLLEGDSTPFHPLPEGYVARDSAAVAFAALMIDDPPEAVQRLVAAILFKTDEVVHDLDILRRGQSHDEVFAIVAFTSDVGSVGLSGERNVWKRLNAVLRQRNLKAFSPFADYYSYLMQGLNKIPPEVPTVVWRGLNEVTLEQLEPQYAVGQCVCFLGFTSTSTLKDVMTYFATTSPGAASVMLRIETCEGRSLQPYSLQTKEAEVLLAPNALCEVTVAVRADAVAELASFPGGEQLPARTAMVTLKQLPTPVPVVITCCDVGQGQDSPNSLRRRANKRSPLVESFDNIPLGFVFASGGSAQIRSVAGRSDTLAKIYHPHVLSNAEGYQRETDILQSLRHDYIVSIRGLIKDGDVVRGYLMEAMDGNLLNTTALTSEQRLVALRHCAEGLNYAHSRDITHGDVKPENCLVSVRNDVVTAKVCDFVGMDSMHSGTIPYVAPEGNTHSGAADVFAFGMTIWMVLSAGHGHGLGNSIADVMRGIAEGRRPPLDIPSLQALPSYASLCTLLQQCWAAAPTRRPTMAEVMLELQNILRSMPLVTMTPDPPLPAMSSLTWSRFQRYRVSSSLTADHDLFQRVASLLHRDPSLSRCCVRRVQLVQHGDRDVFWRIHRAEAESLKRSEYLRAIPPTTAAAKAASAVLDIFAAKAAPHLQALVKDPFNGGNNGLSRIVFAWHGAPEDRLDAFCRDGLRIIRGRDGGYFGDGVYLAMEADFARRYAGETMRDDEQQRTTLILYACSVSQAYPVTLEADYRTPTADRGRDDCGFSRFCDGTASKPLEAKYDAHFVPVRDCGVLHPWDGETPTYRDVDSQAATEDHPNPAMRPIAHELVLGNPLRCTPVALVEVALARLDDAAGEGRVKELNL
jgi:serine/threonine protein kinase